MTQELTQEVEAIVQDFYMIFCGTLDGKVVLTLHDAPEMLSFLREQLTSLAERAEERGVKKAMFDVGWPAVVIQGWKKKGAQAMKEKAIAYLKSIGAGPARGDSDYEKGYWGAKEDAISALTSLSLTNE